MNNKELDEWIKNLSDEDREWIFKEFCSYDYKKAYLSRNK